MSWECKEIEYELKTPIHIGKGQKLGIIDRTRYYIPGKTMWGAAVAKIGKEKDLSDDEEWKDLRDFVRENMIFTYFYIYNKEDSEILIPKYNEDGLEFGVNKLSERKFENKYIASFASAAVEKDSGTSSEGDLHEIELIKDKTDPDKPVYIKGYVLINKDNFEDQDGYDLDSFIESTKKLQVGGERNYGYGKIERVNVNPDKDKLFNIDLELDCEKPIVNIDNNSHNLFAHLLVRDDDESYFSKLKEINGDLEPLVGREWKDSPGKNANYEGVGVAPGSRIKLKDIDDYDPTNCKEAKPEDYDPEIILGDYGLLKFKDESN